jgi:hypothetical protein
VGVELRTDRRRLQAPERAPPNQPVRQPGDLGATPVSFTTSKMQEIGAYSDDGEFSLGWLRARTEDVVACVAMCVSSRLAGVACMEAELYPVELGEHGVVDVERAVGTDVALRRGTGTVPGPVGSAIVGLAGQVGGGGPERPRRSACGGAAGVL